MTKPQYKKLAFGLLFYTLLVILWGAWVRISHSGDGCGDTWPLCHGQLIPEAQRGKTWVEYAHRLMSGIYGFVVIYFWWVARKIYPKTHFVRKAALATLIFTITEALLGAKLVLFKLVTTNDTPYRAFVMALHQINSFMLTGAVALAFAAATLKEDLKKPSEADRRYRLLPWVIVIIGITGAWASLSNSLFPTDNLWEGFMADFSGESHFLIRLRGLHPLLALLGGGGLALFFWVKAQTAESLLIQRRSYQMALTLITGIVFGIATLLLHAPVWMKIAHLALAHTIWVILLQWVFFVRSESVRL
ncbi:COX15/CtaA family protein [Bdellovibrio sp. 22V]|uniref:COX15/CtaA family protein n=1 Tax=Bdellovibrio TaxID=958 RepID=UPI002542D6AE|nr:COX15/CtaA family protein [Bdellovibrio sp. 22V]WII71582.1 COX15/CtaA family protein [Bdellovibrio sp. 22V]